MPRPMLIRGMKGLGDNIYQRGFVSRLHGCYVETPWPELYSDLPVHCVRISTTLRTQRLNVQRSKYAWVSGPHNPRMIRIGYGSLELNRGSIISTMRSQFGVDPEFDLPKFDAPQTVMQAAGGRKIAVIRPHTVRSEWRNEARGPNPEYLVDAASILRARGYYVVSVAHLAAGAEWIVGHAPEADLVLHHGELGIAELLGLIRTAAIVVGGVGWIVPACIAARTPLYCVLGGHGGHNAPGKITDPCMDLSRVCWAIPDHYCRCENRDHKCDKTISNFAQQIGEWFDGHNL